jgi:hypothetical protein
MRGVEVPTGVLMVEETLVDDGFWLVEFDVHWVEIAEEVKSEVSASDETVGWTAGASVGDVIDEISAEIVTPREAVAVGLSEPGMVNVP